MNKDVIIDKLGPIVGSTITNAYVDTCEHSQRYCSYDDGSILVIEYTTFDGKKKKFSIGNGNIRSDNKDPMSGVFVFDTNQTQSILHWGSPWNDDNPHCSDCYEYQHKERCPNCKRCIDCKDQDILTAKYWISIAPKLNVSKDIAEKVASIVYKFKKKDFL